jgi:hypothetical protein
MPDPAIAAEPVSLPAIAEPAEPMSEPAIAEPAEPADPMSDPVVTAEPVPVPSVFFFLQPPTARDKANKVIAMRMRYPPGRMLRGFRLPFIIAAALMRPAVADDLRLPAGTRKDASGTLVSGRGLRDTTDYLARELERRGIAVTQIGPTRIRSAELTRFLSLSPATPWLAIHVLRAAGKTLIFFVPRQSLDERPGTR